MGSVFRVLGIIFCITLALGIVGFAVVAHYGNKLDAETQTYVDQTVPLIVGRWDVEEFMKRASSAFLNVTPRPEVDRLFRVLAERLGSLKACKGSHGSSFMSVTIFNGKQLTGNYMADADFVKGPATIRIRIVWHDPDWQFLGFYVNSPVLIQ